MKKIGMMCALLVMAVAAAFAQSSSADELLKWKELYDSGVITEEEFTAKKNQIINADSNTNNNTASSTTASTVTMQKDEAFKQIEYLIDDDLFDNADRIKALSGNLSPAQKNTLYDEYSKSAGGPFALNFFLGFGIGSFVQGDKKAGWNQLGFELLGISLMTTGLLSSGSAATTLVALGAGFSLGAAIVGYVSPWIYSNTRNSTLKEVLGLTSGSPVTIVPLINPVDQTYGLLANISF